MKGVLRGLFSRRGSGGYAALLRHVLLFLLVIVLLGVNLIPVQVDAAGNINTAEKGSIQVTVNADEPYIDGGTFHIYKVADVDENLQFTSTEQFTDVDVDSIQSVAGDPDATAKQWMDMADTLKKTVTEKKLTPVQTTVMKNRLTTFSQLNVGLYLICADPVKEGNKTVTYQPLVVCLPQGGTAADADWNYAITCHVKGSSVKYVKKPTEKTPVKPTKKTPGQVGRVKTGDIGHLAIWIGLICIAAATALVVIRRKQCRTVEKKTD